MNYNIKKRLDMTTKKNNRGTETETTPNHIIKGLNIEHPRFTEDHDYLLFFHSEEKKRAEQREKKEEDESCERAQLFFKKIRDFFYLNNLKKLSSQYAQKKVYKKIQRKWSRKMKLTAVILKLAESNLVLRLYGETAEILVCTSWILSKNKEYGLPHPSLYISHIQNNRSAFNGFRAFLGENPVFLILFDLYEFLYVYPSYFFFMGVFSIFLFKSSYRLSSLERVILQKIIKQIGIRKRK